MKGFKAVLFYHLKQCMGRDYGERKRDERLLSEDVLGQVKHLTVI